MANALYKKGKESLLNGEWSWSNDIIRAYLINTSLYTVDIDTDTQVSDIPQAAIIHTQILTGKTITDGVADAFDTQFINVNSATVANGVVIAKDNGNLIAYFDTVTGLPITPDGSDIIVRWNDGIDKIFSI